MPREVIDGRYLHEHIEGFLNQATEDAYAFMVDYNGRLTNSTARTGERSMFGDFRCTLCSHRWKSGMVCTQLWYSKAADTYRTQIHAQKCRRCNHYVEPDMDVDNYVQKVTKAISLWKGLRLREDPDEDQKQTPPHDTERCHGCLVGICRRKDGLPAHSIQYRRRR
ncbi:hypothetical protein BGZ70_000051 [Mortierella alpina]|uniref:3CxxC-type domain-containing protein n=1 Tax=Mortierella alpina TaxID=64518 RepID=A0A9P6IYK8_MORAP|nr:hypothetical protein BGZ70_000051 [Mortierella alpina]